MLSGEFQRKIRQLNKDLRIWCGDKDHLPAGLFRMVRGEWETICGVDKNWVPEHTEFHPDGKIKKSGWRRVLRILIRQGLVERYRAEKVFQTHLPYGLRKVVRPKYEPKRDLINKYVVSEGL